jgi:large subunit ribosomal protein L13
MMSSEKKAAPKGESAKKKASSKAKGAAKAAKKRAAGPKKKVSAKKAAGPRTRPLLGGRTSVLNREKVPAKWHVLDVAGVPVGRAAALIVKYLRGKNRPAFHPSQDIGDCVVAVNASKLHFSGRKWTQKVYYRHSGYLGHLKTIPAEKLFARFPDRVLKLAVKGMLPHNNLGRYQLARLFVYADGNHPHGAQKPEPLAAPGSSGAGSTSTKNPGGTHTSPAKA